MFFNFAFFYSPFTSSTKSSSLKVINCMALKINFLSVRRNSWCNKFDLLSFLVDSRFFSATHCGRIICLCFGNIKIVSTHSDTSLPLHYWNEKGGLQELAKEGIWGFLQKWGIGKKRDSVKSWDAWFFLLSLSTKLI